MEHKFYIIKKDNLYFADFKYEKHEYVPKWSSKIQDALLYDSIKEDIANDLKGNFVAVTILEN